MSKYNLGIVKTSLLSNLNESAAIQEFVGLLKESNLLKLEFSIYGNIENKHIANEDLAIKYIDENVKLLKDAGFTKELFEAENKKFLPLVEGVQFSTTDKKELFEKIHTLLYESLPGKKTTNVNKLHDAFSFVLEHIVTNEPKKELVEDVTLPSAFADVLHASDFIVGKAIETYNEKYVDLLTEDEMMVVKSFIAESNNAKEITFNILKENTIKFLSEIVVDLTESKNSPKADLNELREVDAYIERANHSITSIKERKFNEATYMSDVLSFIDIKN